MSILDDIMAGLGLDDQAPPQAFAPGTRGVLGQPGGIQQPAGSGTANPVSPPAAPEATQPDEQPQGLLARIVDTVTTPSKLAPAALRFGAPALAAEGGPTGAAVAGVGEAGAQYLERRFGERTEYSPSEIAAATLAGSIPIGGLARRLGATGVLGRVAAGAGEGATIGAVTSAGRQYGETGEVKPGETAKAAGFGAAVGGTLAGVSARLGKTGKSTALPGEPGEPGSADYMMRTLTPQDRTQAAREFENTVMGPAGMREDLRKVQIQGALDDAKGALQGLTPDEAEAFAIAHSNHERFADPKLQQASDGMSEAARRMGVMQQRATPGVGFLDDYFYPMFKNPEAAKAALARDPEFVLPSGFLKERTSSVADMYAAAKKHGLELADPNPAVLLQMRLGQESRFAAVQDIGKAGERRGGVRFGPNPEPGEAEIDPAIARAMFPGRSAVMRPAAAGQLPFSQDEFMGAMSEAIPTGKRAVAQRAFAPEPLATLINQKLRPGMGPTEPLRWASKVGGYIMSAKIAFSAFHPIFTGLMSAGSALSQGLEKTFGASSVNEAFAGLREFTGGALVVPAVIERLRKGYKLMRMAEDSPIGSMPDPFKLIMRASGRVTPEHQIANGIQDTWRRIAQTDGVLGKAGATFDAISNILSGPVMRGWVPWIKLGSLSSALEHEITQATKANPNISDAAIAGIARAVSDVHDNFFGQMVPANIGFSRWMQDFLHAAIQFPGWNIGTLRTFAALGRGAKRAAFGQELDPVADITSRYALGILVSTGLMGAIVHAIHNDGQLPQSFEDAFYPRTKSGERISMPTHVRTGVSFAQHPIGFVAGKGNPVLQVALDLMDNLDEYANKQIRTPEAGLGQQAGEVAGFLGKQLLPIPISAGKRIAESGEPTNIGNVERFLGFSRAAKNLTRSSAENLAAEYNLAKLPRGGQAPAEAEATRTRTGIVHALRTGASDATARIQKALADGTLQWQDLPKLGRESRQTALQVSFSKLDVEHAAQVWKAASAAEREQLMEMYVRKLRNKPVEAARLGFGASP